MATTAAIAAAAIGAAGSIGGAAISAQGAKAAGRAGRPTTHKFRIDPYARALQREVARAYAMNLGNVPPTFAQFVQSGGEATFPFTAPGLLPKEARALGMIGKHGEPIPFVSPTQTELTTEQKLFLGSQLARDPAGASDPFVRAFKLNQRVGRLLQRHPERENRIEKLRAKRDKLLSRGTGTGELF